jgi:hypothetical protein
MTKLRSKILGGMSVVALVGVVAGTGLTAVSASQVGAAARSGFEHFQIMTTSETTSKQSIIATGLFTAGGVDHSGARVDTAVFSDGTFKIAHSPGIGTPRFNPKTCLGVIALNGTYRLSHGTGAYAGIRGHGIYRVNLTMVAARNSAGKCSDRLPPVAFQVIIRAQGPVSL